MVNIAQINDDYVPVEALIVYQKTGGDRVFESTLPKFFITEYAVFEDGTLGEGSPLTEQFVGALARGLFPLDYIHERVIAQSPAITIWWKPASTARVAFSRDTGVTGGGKYPLPPMVFKLTGGKLYNWALKDNVRPDKTTKLYRSPFFNIYDNGKCCMGNVKVPDALDIVKWEATFIGGKCTDELPPYFRKGTPKDVWNQIRGKDIFPVEILAETGLTVNNIIME